MVAQNAAWKPARIKRQKCDFDGRPACYQKKLLKSRQKARSHCPSDLSFTVKQKYVYRYYVKPMAEPNNLEFPAWGYQKKSFPFLY